MRSLFTLSFFTCLLGIFLVNSVSAQCSDLFFSEYIEGSSNNKVVEIYNPTAAPIDMTGYSVQRFSNGSPTVSGTFSLSGMIGAGSTYVVANGSSNAGILAVADTTSGVNSFNGDDAVALVNPSAMIIDVIGEIGVNPGTEWIVGSGSTANNTLVRMPGIQQGNPNWTTGATEWLVLPTDEIDSLGAHTMDVCGAPGPPLYTISQISGQDAMGVIDSSGTVCRIRGLVYGINLRPIGLSFTFIDPTDGINVFYNSGNFGYTVMEGDSLEMEGSVSQFNGMLTFNPTSVTVISSGNTLKTPNMITQLGEVTESDLVQMDTVWLVDPLQWTNLGTGFNVDVTNGTDTITLRIDDEVDLYGTPAPLDTFIVCGLGGQYDTSSPFDAGYQLLPRYSQDIKSITTAPLIEFTTFTQSETEGNVTVFVTLNLINPSPNPTTIEVALGGGTTASNGTVDFSFTSPLTVTFPANSTADQTFAVSLFDDAINEGNEYIELILQNPTNSAVIGTINTQTITIIDNDYPIYPIAQVTGIDVNGAVDSVGIKCELHGVVYGVNQNPAGLSFTLIDPTDGINVYSLNQQFGYTVMEGDSVAVRGTLTQFNGLLEIIPDTVIYYTSGNPLKTPVLSTMMDETTESDLIIFTGMWLVNPAQWTGTGSGFNVDFTNGTDTLQMRIDNNVNLYSMPAPVGLFNLCGIGGQYDNSSPYLDGYQVLPRYDLDIKPVAAPEVFFDVTTQGASESFGTMFVSVSILNPDANATSVDVELALTGSATAGLDFTSGLPITVTFPAGSSTADTIIEILLTDDVIVEPTETIDLTLTNPTNGAVITGGSQTISIFDNDLSIYTISQVTGNDPAGLPDSAGVACVLRGVVYGVNLFPSGLSFTLIDPTDGIGVFSTANFGYSVMEGDSVEVSGTIGQFNGLTQIVLDGITLISSGNDLKTPTLTTVFDEVTESDLIKVDTVWLVDPLQWTGLGAGFGVDVTNGTDTLVMYIYDDVNLYAMPAPLDTFSLCGIGGQFDNTSPYTEGYQIAPRYDLDLKHIVFGASPVVTFSMNAVTVSEGVGMVNVTVQLLNPNASTTMVEVHGFSGSATSGVDFNFSNAFLVFPAGTTTLDTTIVVNITDDAIPEGNETFTLSLVNEMNALLGANSTITITIEDNDLPTYPIAQVTGLDANGAVDSIGVSCHLSGVVYGVNMTTSGIAFTIIDPTDGIAVYSTNSFGYTVNETDSIEVIGTIGQFNGLAQMNADTVILHSTGNTLKTPTVVTALNEVTESDLVKVDTVWLVDPAQWTGVGSGFNVDITDGSIVLQMRIDSEVNLYSMPAPLDTFNVCGLGGQYDNASPYTDGYQLLPRYDMDIKPVVIPQTVAVSFAQISQQIDEFGGSAMVEVIIVNPDANATSVDVVVSLASTATGGADYTYSTVTVNFPAGSSIADTIIEIPITDDLLDEGNETIVLELQNPTNGASIGTGTHTITILDDDAVVPTYPIAQVTGLDANGEADSSGTLCRLHGVVYGVNMNTTGLSFTIIDPTDGIGVYSGVLDFGYTVMEGDSVEVEGTIDQFNGLTQIYADTVILHTTGNTLKAPMLTTVLDEVSESDLMKVDTVWLVDPAQWTNAGSGFNVDITNGSDTLLMRIDNNVNLYSMSAPLDTFNVCGIGGQYDSSSPYTSGYQLFPRYDMDIKPIVNAAALSVSFSTTSQTIAEDGGSVFVTVTIANPDANATSVEVELNVSSTATPSVDFGFTSTITVTFPAGSSVVDTIIEIPIIDDMDVEADETIVLTLVNPTNGAVIGFGTQTITITDNDSNLPTYWIEQVTTLGADSLGDSVGIECILHGIVYGVNLRPSGLQFTIIDSTDGIGVFSASNNFGYTVNEGDHVEIHGVIDQFAGLLQIVPSEVIFHSANNPLKIPTLTTELNEVTESDLIKVDTVWLVDPAQWIGGGAGFTCQVTNGSDTLDMRIDNDVNLSNMPVPADTFNLCGLGGQYDNSAPHDEGYQIMPRYDLDIKPLALVGGLSVSFSTTGQSIAEDGGSVFVTVTIANPDANTTSVDVILSASSATEGVDFSYTTTVTVNFPMGSTTADTIIEIPILDDFDTEGDETIVLSLQNATNGAAIGFGTQTITIVDNELPVYDIAQVTGQNADGVADSLGVNCILRGVVYGVNMNGTGLSFTLIDPTDGIGVYRGGADFGYTVTEKDSVEVWGMVDQFNGLTQIVVDTVILLTPDNDLKTPMVVTTLDEVSESDLVQINAVTLVDPAQWTGTGSGFNVDISNGTDTLTMRIDADVNLYGMSAPTGWFNVCGIGGQYDSSSPYTSGYQLFPRYDMDIKPIVYVDLGPDTTVCEGQNIMLDAGNPGSTYLWSTGETTQTIMVTPPANITVTVDGTASDEIVITEAPLPVAGFTIDSSNAPTLEFTNTSVGATSYSWDFGDGSNSGSENPSHFYTTDGAYTIVLTAENECGTTTASETISVGTSIDALDLAGFGIKMYPNPASNVVYLELGTLNPAELHIQMIDAKGSVIKTADWQNLSNTQQLEIRLGDVPTGIYHFMIQCEEGAFIQKLMVK